MIRTIISCHITKRIKIRKFVTVFTFQLASHEVDCVQFTASKTNQGIEGTERTPQTSCLFRKLTRFVRVL